MTDEIHYVQEPTPLIDVDAQAKASFAAGQEDGYARGVAHGTFGTLLVLLLLYLVYV